ncbi:serine/threonine-protein kinase [Micromonosporaceae bacterium Da 78-11]
MLTAGHLLGNRYRLDERIATGGMGDVWRGTDVVLGRIIAVKVLRTAMLTDPEFAARFYGEARMMAAFRHPGVVEVYDYASADDGGDDEQVAYLVMAYVEGEPLSARVKQGPMDVTETMSIVAQAADALHAAHEAGTVHRDVKPGNLIVKPTGAVILVDFGVARSAAVTSVTGLNAIVGTALYMAPEQVAKGNVTAATDIYALGAVAYHCIAGRPPFDGDNALQVALRHLEDEPDPLPAHVPPAIRELIAKAMAKQPGDRFATAAEFATAAVAAAGPMDWKKLTGTSMVAPLSPAAPTRAVPLPRDLPFAGRPTSGPSTTAAPGTAKSRSQTALLMAVIVMVVLAGGLGIAIAMQPDKKGSEQVQIQQPPASADATDDAPVESTFSTTEPTTTVRTNRPNGTNPKPSASVATSRSASPSVSVSTSTTPSTTPSPSATTPTTKPTSKPTDPPATTTPPETTPTTTPAVPPNPGGTAAN